MTTTPHLPPPPSKEALASTLERLERGELQGTKELRLQADLTRIPDSVFDIADTLELLDLSNNRLTELPARMAELSKLKILFCSNNSFEQLPKILGQCRSLQMIGFKSNRIRQVPAESLPNGLRWLILTDNHIELLPPSLGDCLRLQKLMLAGNQLRRLPASVARCTQLELIRLSANAFETIPREVLNLPRLAWLAVASNPALSATSDTDTIAESPYLWHDLVIGRQLGEGASGWIYAAQWQHQDVAVKVYKAAMTSDGLPQAELNAWRRAGNHPGLIPLLGEVSGHPDGRLAVLMPRLPSSLKTLAEPPNFVTCTRDVYPSRLNLSTETTRSIAHQVAQALAHLHQRGVCHGDLYGHNLQVDQDANVLLGDFGAASCYHDVVGNLAAMLQRIERRAFGHLLSELIQQTSPACPPAWKQLAHTCTLANSPFQPTFEELAMSFSTP